MLQIIKAKLFPQNKFLLLLTTVFVLLWLMMYLNCIDKQDWFLENILVFIFFGWMLIRKNKFDFSNRSIFLIFLFLLLHVYGAMYAYTQNPIGEYFQNKYLLKRNPYDRVVHFSFGFLLAYPLYEILKNNFTLKRKWLFILPLNIITSLACIFELIEWGVAATTTSKTGETYVATQGDVWDAHKDIVLAMLGAFTTMVTIFLIKRFKKD